MRLKIFHAATMHAAMQQVKKELGDDAVIVATRQMEDGRVRVTAAVDDDSLVDAASILVNTETGEVSAPPNHAVPDKKAPLNQEPAMGFDDQRDLILQRLVWHNVPSQVTDKIIGAFDNMQPEAGVRATLAKILAQVFDFDPLPTSHYERPLMLVGQPGTGKTVTIAKLAARAVMHGLKPVVITADIVRAGAVAQLQAYCDVLQVPLFQVNTAAELHAALKKHQAADYVLVDCPGLNVFEPADIKMLSDYAKHASLDVILTIAAGIDREEAADLARAFGLLGARWLIPTRIDMARRLGALLAAADIADLKFAGLGCGPQIAQDYEDLTPLKLAQILLPKFSQNAEA